MELLFTTSAIAGGSVLWRNWLEHHEEWKNYIKKTLGSLDKVLLCGSCFTYWLSLFALYFINPFYEFSEKFNSKIIFFIASWMALSYLSVFLRFVYILIQETVSEKVHKHSH
jgi:hypothetical protein